MEEAQVKQLVREGIAEALLDGGAIHSGFQSEFSKLLGELGAVKIHVQAVLSFLLGGPIADAIEKAKNDIASDTKVDAAYPFRKVLRAAASVQIAAA